LLQAGRQPPPLATLPKQASSLRPPHLGEPSGSLSWPAEQGAVQCSPRRQNEPGAKLAHSVSSLQGGAQYPPGMVSNADASRGEPKQSRPGSHSLETLQRPPNPEGSADGGGSAGGSGGGPFGCTTSELGLAGSMRRGGASLEAAGTGRSISSAGAGSGLSELLQAAPNPAARANTDARGLRIAGK
jgi:hypothetical protein